MSIIAQYLGVAQGNVSNNRVELIF